MAGAGSRKTASSDRVWRQPRFVGWLILALVGICAHSVVGEDYDGYGYQPPRPPRAGGGERGGGGFVGPLAIAATTFTAAKFLWSGRRKNRVRRSLEQEKATWGTLKSQDVAAINEQFSEIEQSLLMSLDEKHQQAKQLEQFLYSLPDTNHDGLITRHEFDRYMSEYKRTHPELTDLDLPRFEDMDHNNNGHINFREWEEYQMMAMNAIS